MTSINKLLSICSEPLSRLPVAINVADFRDHSELYDQLTGLLQSKNGFYGFESALHVFPAAPFEKEMTLGRWNTFSVWRNEYGRLSDNMLFFAEDAFGNQFCLHHGGISVFEAETGRIEIIANTVEEWADRVLADYNLMTGYPLLHRWQTVYGRLPMGMRLVPKIPFVLGGEYDLENLSAMSAVSGMKSRGNLAVQLVDLPDGAQVEYRIIE